MSHNIKQLKPKKHGRTQQGYIDRKKCQKLFESTKSEPIIFRSSWERVFIEWCETSPMVEKWGSECCKIKYDINGEHHTYYPDFVLQMKGGEIWVVEIKPLNETKKPLKPNSYAWNTYCKNMYKWRAAKEFCESHGWKFKIFTEVTIKNLGNI